MCDGSARLFSASLRSVGIDARTSPEGDARTRELAAKHLTGDECYPQMVTLGNFLKLAEEPGFDPAKVALFMPTATGPCRFGQYAHITRKVFDELGYGDAMILSPTCDDGYRALGENGGQTMRYVWWALVSGDLLRKMLHRYRPYEKTPGATDDAYESSLAHLEEVIADRSVEGSAKFRAIVKGLEACRSKFRAVEADFSKPKLLVGVIGEIFCRLSTYSNEDVVRRIEAHGGEAWLADIAEWVYYVNYWEREELRLLGRSFTPRMLKSWLTDHFQHKDEHSMTHVFAKDLAGREEPEDIGPLLEGAKPWLEPHAALGEMVLNIGKSVYLAEKGVDAIMDISPFSCMNGIVSEALYPKLSEKFGGMPIRVFYFDGTGSNLDEDVEMFMELAAHYSRTGKKMRKAG